MFKLFNIFNCNFFRKKSVIISFMQIVCNNAALDEFSASLFQLELNKGIFLFYLFCVFLCPVDI
jgi:predicted membrane protein